MVIRQGSIAELWRYSMARQPEPDLEFTEEELDQTTATRPVSAMKPGKKSRGGRPLLWIFLLLLVGGIGYLAMEPEQLADWLAPFTGDSPSEPAAVATRPKPAPPTVPPPIPPADAPAAPPAASDTLPTPAAPTVPPSTPPSSMAPATTPTTPPVTVASPMFAEGQKVTAIGNPTAPAETIPLSLDPAGMKPGPVIRPGITLNVLDGDLQPGGWVYSVRTDDGVKGWIPEKRLRLKF
jgi:hypothetical protein